MANVLLVGATGLVGQELLKLLLDDDNIGHIYAPTRTPLPAHSKIVNPVGADLRILLDELVEPVDTVFCCLGSTLREAGSKNQFHYVDYILPLYTGLAGLRLHAQQYVVVSALGANERSPFFYNRIKGEMEQALQAQQWKSLTIARPSMLLGKRATSRIFETLAAPLFFLLPGKWRAIKAKSVARAMLKCASTPQATQSRIVESNELRRLGKV